MAADLEQTYGINPYGAEFWGEAWTVNKVRVLGLLSDPGTRLYRALVAPHHAGKART